MKNCNKPAYPIGKQIDAMNMNEACNGLTKREAIAMHLYAGMLSATDQDGEWTGIDCAQDAVRQADELLEALKNM